MIASTVEPNYEQQAEADWTMALEYLAAHGFDAAQTASDVVARVAAWSRAPIGAQRDIDIDSEDSR